MKVDVSGRDPFREFQQILDSWRGSFGQGAVKESAGSSNWSPACDVKESENEITVIAEVPGVTLDDINIEVTSEGLTISGERKFQHPENEKWIRVERNYGTFQRGFAISIPIDVSAVRASLKDGLLVITLPKSEDIKPKKISIQAG